MTQSSKGLQHKAGHDPRAAALVALHRVLTENVDSQAALDGVLGSVRLMPTDKRLCTEIVYGSLRWYLRLRAFSEHFLSRPEKLPEEMRLTLVTALYEMVFLRVPHHAAVNWAVSHVRNRFGKGLAGVANGALRSMQRKLSEFNGPSGAAQSLHARYAMPKWIVSLWADTYGEDVARQLLAASQEAPPAGLRINRARPGWQALLGELSGNESAGQGQEPDEAGQGGLIEPALLYFHGSLPWQARTLIKEGRASRQSGASYQALHAFAPQTWPRPLWDCCAGRGGKTLALLESGVAVSLASDPSRQRLSGLGKEYARLAGEPGEATAEDSRTDATEAPAGTLPPCPPALAHDASLGPEALAEALAGLVDEGQLTPRFGTILVDAPCSGLGTLARRPEIRLRRTPEDITRLAGIQRAILDAAWRSLMPGGKLVYLTCTVSPEENELQTRAFTEAHADARLAGEYRTPPDSPLREFFYGALLEKNG